jgi:hypothetical protein
MRALKAAGKSQQWLEKEAELGKGYLSTAKRRGTKMMRPEKLTLVAKLLGVQVIELVGDGDVDSTERPMRQVKAQFVDRDRRYSEQEMAERVLVSDGWPERDVLLASGAVGAQQEGDRPSTWWRDRILERLTAGRHAAKIGASPSPVGRQPTEDELEAAKPKGFRPGKRR